MLRILSDNGDISVQTGRGEIAGELLFELMQVCSAVIGTLAKDVDTDPEIFKQLLIGMLEEEASLLECIGREPGTLHVLSN